jgi:tetraacyldisaccharide 4'-kinase
LYFSEETSFSKLALRTVLAPFVPLYATGRRLHQSYRAAASTTVSTPVISVGNLAVGGTGKTPFVGWLIEQCLDCDRKPAVLKRGEGQSQGFVPERTEHTPDLASLAVGYGDEAAVYRMTYPEIPLAVGSDRVELAQSLSNRSDVDVIVMDDGFQYRLLQRELDLVLLRETDFLNNWQLPAGPLREPISALERADFISIYGKKTDPHQPVGAIPETVDHLSHNYRFDRIDREGEDVTEDYTQEESILVTTLARPEELKKFLRGEGIDVGDVVSRPDHSDPNQTVKTTLEQTSHVLVTEKEWIKLEPELKRSVGVVHSELTVDGGDRLIQTVKSLLDNVDSDS